MKINELIKKIRENNEMTVRGFSEKLNVTHSFISKVEAGERKVSEKFLAKILTKFPLYKNELLKAYELQNLPENLKEEISLREITEEVKPFIFKVIHFNSEGNGEVDVFSYKELEFMITKDLAERIERDGFVFEILGEKLKPIFKENDTIVIFKEKLQTWQELDKNMVLVEIGGKKYIRKVGFKDGEGYLIAFNEELYPKMKISDFESLKYIGQLGTQLNRDVKGIKF